MGPGMILDAFLSFRDILLLCILLKNWYLGHFLHLYLICALNDRRHCVCTECIQDKNYSFQIWEIFCGAYCQRGELAPTIRKGRYFLIDCKIHKI